jgi:hypothetical protein
MKNLIIKFTEIINKTRIAFAILVITAIMTSCVSFHDGNMQNSASLSQANFKFIKQNIAGESKSNTFLLLISSGSNSLVADAKKNLYDYHLLKENQAFVNLTLSYKTTYNLGVFIISTKCIVTADVVEFTQ